MKDENKELARGLQRRDPELFDALIEQYQFRLFRYLVYITGDRTRAEDFFSRKPGFVCWSVVISTTASRVSKVGCLLSRATW